MYRQKPNRMWIRVCAIALLLSLLNPIVGVSYAQEVVSSPVLEQHVFLPLITNQPIDQAHENDKLVAAFSIAVGENGEPVIIQTYTDATDEISAAEVSRLMPSVVIVPNEGVNASEASAISCPSGGTGASRIGSGWFQNPPPDYDFYVDYKLPKNFKEATVCITAALWAALQATGKKLDVRWYYNSYDSSNWRTRIVIGATVVRNLCTRLTGSPNCANSLLQIQATLRYTT